MTEVVDLIVGQIIGNLSTVTIGILLYYNFLLFEDYVRLIVWSFLLSQALRTAKENVVAILKNLSENENAKPLLSTIYELATNTIVARRFQRRRAIRTFLLDHGIFIFALIGAFSVIAKMVSWFAFLWLWMILVVLAMGVLWLVDRRVFYYRYFISDKVLVSILLIIGMFGTGGFVILYLGTESFMEGSKAASDISNYVQKRVINDETTRRIWNEQFSNGQAMISQGLIQVEERYNETMWWPPLKNMVLQYYNGDAMVGYSGNESQHGLQIIQDSFHRNISLYEAISLANEKVSSLNFTMAQVTDWSSMGLGMSSLAVGSIAQIVVFVATMVIAFIGLGIRAVFFITTLFYLLRADTDPIERFVNDLLPLEPTRKPAVLRSLRRSIEGVFFLPVKISSLHAIITLISFTALDADFIYLGTFLTFFISVVPIVPPYLVCVPWAVTICGTTSVFRGIVLFLVHYFLFGLIDDALYGKSLGAINSYVSALSVVFGVYVFGFEGVVFGPLLVCGVSFAYELSGQSILASTHDEEKSPSKKIDKKEEPKSMFRFDSFSGKDSSANIFSNAYRAIKGDGFFKSSKGEYDFASSSGTVRMNLKFRDHDHRKFRFVASKDWNMNEFIEAIERNLRIHGVTGVNDAEGNEIISVAHIDSNETLYLQLANKVNLSKQFSPRGSARRYARSKLSSSILSHRESVATRLKRSPTRNRRQSTDLSDVIQSLSEEKSDIDSMDKQSSNSSKLPLSPKIPLRLAKDSSSENDQELLKSDGSLPDLNDLDKMFAKDDAITNFKTSNTSLRNRRPKFPGV